VVIVSTDERSFIEHLWDLFCSLKLTMFLLIFLATISIIGTVIPQGPPAPEYVAQITPAKLKLYQGLGFFDMYHSWWFILSLYLLSVNLVACSLKRLPRIWQIVSRPVTLLESSLEQSLSCKTTFRASSDPQTLRERAAAFLTQSFAEPVLTEQGGAWHLFAQKTPWCRFSVYVVHLSVLVIFAGAIIGSLFGYKAYVNILEGESVSTVMSRGGKAINLGFEVRCEKFSAEFYDSGAPKEFKSILTVLENGTPVPGYEKLPIIVNRPLTYKGITFYQSSYGNAGQYFFTVTDLNGKNPVPVTITGNESLTLPDGKSAHLLETTADISPFSKGLSGPAARLEIHSPDGGSERVVVYANHPELNIEHARQHGTGPVIHYKGAKERSYTGLQVAKDPGVWVVWLGCSLMVMGIFAAFFLSHRRIWVRIQDGSVTMGGNASKNQAAFQQTFDTLAEGLKQHLS
jgi:cytochrome c biogenesis protein